MAKRLSDSDLWNRDWFLDDDMKGRFQLFCLYLRDHCDHAGVWNPSFKRFEQSTGFRINPSDYLSIVNKDRVRVCVLDNGKWWVVGFIEDQYKTGMILNESFNPIKGVLNSLRANNVPYNSYGYNLRDSDESLRVGDESLRSKDQDKDKNQDKDFLESKEGMQGEIISTRIPEHRECSELLKKRILEHRQAKINERRLIEWDRDVRLMIERDERTIDQIKTIINECHDMPPGPTGFTWRNNILSMAKLRNQWNDGKISIGMTKNNSVGNNGFSQCDFQRKAAGKYDNLPKASN